MTVIDYSARDYEAVRQALISRIPDHLPEWRSRSPNDFGIVLLELFAYSVDLMNYYADRVANEAFLGTAVLESSVYDLAKMMGYVPKSVNSASGLVNFTLLPPPRTGVIRIPAGTMLRSNSADPRQVLYFSTITDIVVEPEEVALNGVQVIEGRPISEIIGYGTGGPGQTFVIPYEDIDTDDMIVSVGMFEWSRTLSLMNGTASGRYYALHMLPDRTWAVVFGDGVNGAIPPPNIAIRLKGRRSSGTLGNVAAGAVNVITSNILGLVAVTNPQTFTGGEDAETADQIRATLPAALYAVDRAVTLLDYESLAVNFPGVAKAQATAAVYTNVTVFVVAIGGTGLPSATLKGDLQEFLAARSLVNVTVGVESPVMSTVYVEVMVKRAPDTNVEDLTFAINAAIRQRISWEHLDINFNMHLVVDVVYEALKGVAGIDYAIVSKFYETDGFPGMAQELVFDVGEFPTVADVVVIYI